MKQLYKTIGLIGKPNHEGAKATIEALHQHLHNQNYQVLVEDSVAQTVDIENINIASLTEIPLGTRTGIIICFFGRA